jgi:hypothetical protein
LNGTGHERVVHVLGSVWFGSSGLVGAIQSRAIDTRAVG